jgi:MFS transporter, OFA family, oxalate/formate antiporter
MILIGTDLALASAAQSLVQVYAAYGLGVGLGVGCSYVPAMGAVQRWFIKSRGFTSGLASSGIGAGTLVVPPLVALFIVHLGWREAYLLLGVLATPSIRAWRNLPPCFWSASSASAARSAGPSIAAAVKSKRILGLYAACLFCAFGVFVPFVHLTPDDCRRGGSAPD